MTMERTFRGYRLEPFDGASLGRFVDRLRAPETWEPYSWFGYGPLAAVPGSMDSNGGLEQRSQLQIISADGACAGRATWARGGRYGGNEQQGCWVVGVLILPEHRHTSAAYAGLKLLVDYLFSTTAANRVESFTSGARHHLVARKIAGLRYEGTLRGAQWRDGSWHDVACFATTRADWSASDT